LRAIRCVLVMEDTARVGQAAAVVGGGRRAGIS